MKIVVSTARKANHFHKRVDLEKKTKRDVCFSFREIGYRLQNGGAKYVFKSEFRDMADLEFANVYEAKGWLQAAGAFKEAK